MNAIAANYNYYSKRSMKIPITDNIGKITEFFNNQKHDKRIFKTHLQSYSLINVWQILDNDYYLFYVIRDGKDAITSLYNLYKTRDKKVKGETIGEFLKGSLPAAESAYKVAIKKPTTVLDMWNYHIESWVGKPKIFYVHYEDLIEKFESVVRAIGKFINMTPPKTIISPSKTDNVIHPGPGIIGDHKNYFTKEDTLYFKQRTIYTNALIKFNKKYIRY